MFYGANKLPACIHYSGCFLLPCAYTQTYGHVHYKYYSLNHKELDLTTFVFGCAETYGKTVADPVKYPKLNKNFWVLHRR